MYIYVSSMRLRRNGVFLSCLVPLVPLAHGFLRGPTPLSQGVWGCLGLIFLSVFFDISLIRGSGRSTRQSWAQLGSKLVQHGGVWGSNLGPPCAKLSLSCSQMGQIQTFEGLYGLSTKCSTSHRFLNDF